MSRKEDFLSTFSPLPEGTALPERVTLAYEPVSCLNQRETRSVFLLHRRADGAPFVLKAIPGKEENLTEEFRILNQLAPALSGTVPLPVDCFREGDTCYLLRSYLPGETLAQYRERIGNCSSKDCAVIGQKLCALLEVLHSQDPPVVHRDIKPENIILLPDGRVGLIDFGIARQYKGSQDTDTRYLGTRTTAAPEQYGYSQTDPRTDLYALGMTLIWLLTGQYDHAALKKAENIPRWLIQVLERASAFDPEGRYANAAALGEALRGRKSSLKTWASALLLLLFATLALGTILPREPGTRSENVVTFNSVSLEYAVRAELERPEGDITYGDLAGVERLALVGETAFDREQVFDYRVACYLGDEFLGDAPAGDVSDLSLMAHMPNLKELHLNKQQITDLSPLAGLSLTTLTLCDNQITDLSPLSGMDTLETLYLGGNPATDHSPLASLTGLKALNLDGGAGFAVTESLSFLETLDLRELSISMLEPRDGDWSPLSSQQRLDSLHVWSPTQRLMEIVGQLPHLRVLKAGNWPGGDLAPIAGCTTLEVLSIYNGLESLDGAEHLTNLLTLALQNSTVADLSPLAGLPWLNYVVLESLPITDFSALRDLPALTYVQVNNDQVSLVEAACPGYTFRIGVNP